MNKFFRVIATLFTSLLLFQGSIIVYADGSPEPEDNDSKETTQVTDTSNTSTPKKALTPDGNLTLVDDIKTNNTNDKEFLTVVSKSGNYFYIIVDRADNGEMNVHFLNLVDERDLLDLIDEETKEPEPEPIIIEPTPIEEPDPEPETPKKSGIGGIIALLALLGLAAGGVYYYFNFIKPNQENGNPDNLDDFDWDDEDEDIEIEIVEDEEDYPQFARETNEPVGVSSVTTIEEQEKIAELQDELFGEEEE